MINRTSASYCDAALYVRHAEFIANFHEHDASLLLLLLLLLAKRCSDAERCTIKTAAD